MTSYRIVAILLLVLAAVACGGKSNPNSVLPQGDLIAVGSRVNFSGFLLVVYPDGRLIMRDGSQNSRSRLGEEELSELRQLLASRVFAAALRQLEVSGYRVGCCDAREVSVEYSGRAVGYAVCDGPALSAEVAIVIAFFNTVREKHFRDLHEATFPLGACGSGS